MAQVSVTSDHLTVTLSRREKVGGLLRDLTVPIAEVREVEVVPDALAAVRGLRAPGLGIPGVRKIGTWRGRHGKTYVSASRREPGLVITLADARYDRVVVGTPQARHLADRLHRLGVPHR